MVDAALPRLLLVDDEAPLRLALGDTLGANGYLVRTCAGAEEALEALRESRFEVLLTDLHMPGVNGISLLRSALEIDPDLVGIVMTGVGSIGTAVDAMQAGALDYIQKPFKLNTALPILARALKVRALRLENAALDERVRKQMQELAIANRDLEAFASSVSHDLRAPLQVIDGFSAVLADRYAERWDDKGLDYLKRIRGAVRRMQELIDGMLRLAHFSRQPIEMRTIDMTRLAREAASELCAAGQAQESWIEVADLPTALGDATLLRQVWANLLSNACKFSARSPSPRVSVGCDLQPGAAAYFVRDNGAGFDMAYAQQLFEPFMRLHKADEFPGLGVGLSIVQRVVVRHGGRIWAQSREGEGACFHFTLEESKP